MVALQESICPTTWISCRAKEDCPSCEGAPNVWWVTHTMVTEIEKWKISGKIVAGARFPRNGSQMRSHRKIANFILKYEIYISANCFARWPICPSYACLNRGPISFLKSSWLGSAFYIFSLASKRRRTGWGSLKCTFWRTHSATFPESESSSKNILKAFTIVDAGVICCGYCSSTTNCQLYS